MAETLRLVLLHPSRAFSAIREERSVGGALGYALLLGTICTFVGAMISLGLEVLLLLIIGRDGGLFQDPSELAVTIGPVLAVVVLAPVAITILVFVSAGILHLCLMMVGGANRSFGATFCVVAYIYGSTSLFALVPACGGLIAFVWGLVARILGTQSAHRTTTGRAALAVFLPLMFCCGFGAGLAIMAVLLGGIAAGGGL